MIRAKHLHCPVCGSNKLSISENKIQEENLIQVIYTCDSCKKNYYDIFPIKFEGAKEITLKIENKEDLFTKILKSSGTKIIIPELETEIEPGPISETYITNVEGILERVKSALKMAKKWGKNTKEKEILLKNMTELKKSFKIILIDPLGVSKVYSKKAYVKNI